MLLHRVNTNNRTCKRHVSEADRHLYPTTSAANTARSVRVLTSYLSDGSNCSKYNSRYCAQKEAVVGAHAGPFLCLYLKKCALRFFFIESNTRVFQSCT